jgi:FtsP/CotA-like multicopper oxidase with cupredoxin domain
LLIQRLSDRSPSQLRKGDRLGIQVQLDTVEDWEITNTEVMDHPVRIRIPFREFDD